MSTDYDILIVGGGMVGASLAIALGNLPLRVALIEAVEFESNTQPSYDDRTIALSYGSKRIFDTLGIWSRVETGGATAIQHIHISDRGRFGFSRLAAADAGVEAMGWVVENRALGQALKPFLTATSNLTFLCPATMQDIEFSEDAASVTIRRGDKTEILRARLVVAADGGASAVRERAGIVATRTAYHQTALVTNITPEQPHRNVAYERFTDSGPLALLPMSANRCAVVWSLPPESVEAMLALDDAAFLTLLQERFGTRLGRFLKVGKRAAYPLAYTKVAEHISPRLVLIGNAAHTVHPVAGQGFNLGLRDVAALAEVMSQALSDGKDIGALDVLQQYVDWRRRDVFAISTFTNSLVRIFSNDFAPLGLARNLGLVAVDLFPPAKRALLRLSMGLGGRLPRLARGLPLQ
ncbi:MAG: 2-octaprenyl-6-methoxyphenyl hydroxylase [Gammaproteobacteria bacterium]|nr:2-octaprenyl-6-methoxyphenyl hydroxylase [Gammaproteobacteria bacterium]